MYSAAACQSAGPVELKRATLGSKDRPRVEGGPGVGNLGLEKRPAGGRGPRPLGARGGHALTRRVVGWANSVHTALLWQFVLFENVFFFFW